MNVLHGRWVVKIFVVACLITVVVAAFFYCYRALRHRHGTQPAQSGESQSFENSGGGASLTIPAATVAIPSIQEGSVLGAYIATPSSSAALSVGSSSSSSEEDCL